MTPAQKRRIWFENFHQAFDTLRSHKFRSVLTMLGIFIGIAVLIVVASIMTGMRKQIVNLIEEYGTNNIYAFHLNTGMQVGRRSRKEMERKPLKPEYADAILARCDAVQDVAMSIYPRRLPSNTVKYQGTEYKNGSIQGVTPNILAVTNIPISQGRPFTEMDDNHRLQNCIIGDNVAQTLFPISNPIGKEITIAGRPFTVIGVQAKRKANAFGENEEDSSIYIPFYTLQKISPLDDWVFLNIQAKSGMVNKAMEQVEQTLRSLRKLKSKDDNDFSLSTADSIIQQFDQVTAMIIVVTIAISAVGLMVGGIGVMNIMLVSVRERTREIGVRKAIGARHRDITIQFLIEAMTLTGAGGLFGIIFSALVGILIAALVPGLPATTPLWAVVIGLMVSVIIGLLFGVWPATRAARLDPIEALRYE